LVGLERIGNFDLLRGQKIVYSDSKSGLDLLKNFRSTNFLAFHIFHFARDLLINRGIKVYSCKVKSHSGVLGNELADQLAKSEASSDGESVYNYVPLSYIKTCIKDNFWKSWFKEALESLRPINHSPVNDWTIFFLPKNLNKSKIFRFSKLADFYTTQIVTAHGKFSEYLFNFGKVDSSLCRMCNLEDDSPRHILFDCIETR